MTDRKVTFEFVFEYSDFEEYSDEELEDMAWETLVQNFNDYRPQGTVETVE